MDLSKFWQEVKETWAELKANPITFLFIYVIAKIIGHVWVFAAIPFRKYARSVVYNGVFKYDMHLKRLEERNPTETEDGWLLEDIHNVNRQGFIKKRKVNKLQFWLVVLFIWGWLDDDSNEDTTDKGHILSFVSGSRTDSLPAKLFGKQLAKIDWDSVVYGNSFDLGDVRAEHPFFNFWATLIWNTRNTSMNFKYLWLNY